MSKDKVVRIDEETHTVAIERAKERGMTLKGYLRVLIMEESKKAGK